MSGQPRDEKSDEQEQGKVEEERVPRALPDADTDNMSAGETRLTDA